MNVSTICECADDSGQRDLNVDAYLSLRHKIAEEIDSTDNPRDLAVLVKALFATQDRMRDLCSGRWDE